MGAGRPQKAHPGTLYAVAHQFYWDFRRLSEGRSRWFLDKNKHEQLQRQAEEADHLQLTDEQKGRAREVVEEEIKSGRLKVSDRENRIRDIEDGQLLATREGLFFDAAEEAKREVKIPGEPDKVEALLDPKVTPEQVRLLCRDAFMIRKFKVGSETREVDVPAWPILPGSTLPGYLSQYAEQYVAALRDPRFPRCNVSKRPSSRLKQLWFVSRALAGALCGITSRTAVNLVGSLRPEEVFQESGYAKRVRKQRKRRHKS